VRSGAQRGEARGHYSQGAGSLQGAESRRGRGRRQVPTWSQVLSSIQYFLTKDYTVVLNTEVLLQTPGLGSEHLNKKKLFFKARLFSCYVVDFILRSFLFTHIEVVILTTKKDFLHRALLFLL